jgi:TolA-binding protein
VASASSTHEATLSSAPARSGEAETDSRLTREVDLVDRARAALSRGDTGAALEALDRYEREVQRGRLGAEAMYLRMEALSRQGDHARAANAARRLLSAYPDGPHAARAKALVGITER